MDVVRGRQTVHVRPEVAHRFRVLPFDPRREPETHVGHALLVLALHRVSHLGEASAVVGHHNKHRVVEMTSGVHGAQESQHVIVGELQICHGIVAELHVEQEAELWFARVHVKEVSDPVEHVDVAGYRADAVRLVAAVLALRLNIERPHVVVDGRLSEAEHPVLEGPESGTVLSVLRRVPGVPELFPHPGMVVNGRGASVTASRLRQLHLVESREDRKQGLRRAVAHYVVRFEHDSAERLRVVAMRARQHAQPRHARRRIETKHEDVQRHRVLVRCGPTGVHAGVVGDPESRWSRWLPSLERHLALKKSLVISCPSRMSATVAPSATRKSVGLSIGAYAHVTLP